MAQARAQLAKAITRLDELSDLDRARLEYLEERSSSKEQVTHENRQAAEDLFHAANNALFVLTTNLAVVARHLKRQGGNGPEVRRCIELMAVKVSEIARINRRLLATSGDGTEPLYLIHAYVSLRSVIERSLSVYEDVAREKGIRISWKLPDFPAIAIWTDAVAIGEVLDNLLSNAIKFSQPGGPVAVKMYRTPTELVCEVRDEGPGLSSADLEQLFLRGGRLRPRPTAGESSSGYGLAIAHDVIESLGGRIWCESTLGRGSSFLFALPMDTREAST